jgi:hypothetical protein
VLSTFGDTETNEGSVCEVVSGRVDRSAVPQLFVSYASKGGQP